MREAYEKFMRQKLEREGKGRREGKKTGCKILEKVQ